ncbi:hypothetical protein DL546_007502 [Coniochaeta pulveracea]|uniref:Uncharacterized protein n=1 Tax=Coniochaeta pulveracea TaxID=177199 RepID=A0A420YH22_9PEZI|nr:hypothetical protein DL546_007502 [Coniochaeta pulveracea]
MAIPNPIYGIVLPFLCLFTLPLAIFAGITTALAFCVLMFRVVLVYVDIALSLVPLYLLGRAGPAHAQQHHRGLSAPYGQGQWSPTPTTPTGTDGSGLASPSGRSSPLRSPTLPLGYWPVTTGHRSTLGSPILGRRSRRPSLSANSAGAITPGKDAAADVTIPFAFPSTTTSSTSGIARDFEGIGGWRLGQEADDDSDWAKINSRLELPLERMSRQSGQESSHHYRTPTVGSTGVPVTPGEGGFLMMKSPKRKEAPHSVESSVREEVPSRYGRIGASPNSSRVRLGQGVVHFTDGNVHRGDGYFPAGWIS